MKHLNFTKLLTLTLICGALSFKTFAQGDVTELIKAGPGDATKLATAYLNPFFKGFGFGMNSAWYNSAKAKNLGRFDLRIQASAAVVPTKDQSFDIRTLGLSTKTRLNNPNNFSSPTAFGEDITGPQIDLYDDNNQKVADFEMPQGSGFNYVPSPQIQLTVGLIKSTDVSIRYSPKIGDINDFGTVQVLGFGVKHEITKMIFGKAKKIIPVDIALAFGYNQIKYNYEVPLADQINDQGTNVDLKQRVEAKFSGYTFDAILSKKLAIFTPFVSVGYNSAKSDIGILGDYIVRTKGPTITDPQATQPDKFSTFTDPVKIKNSDINGLRGNVGFALHLLIFRVYGAYSIGQYSAYTAGIGLGIGK